MASSLVELTEFLCSTSGDDEALVLVPSFMSASFLLAPSRLNSLFCFHTSNHLFPHFSIIFSTFFDTISEAIFSKTTLRSLGSATGKNLPINETQSALIFWSTIRPFRAVAVSLIMLSLSGTGK